MYDSLLSIYSSNAYQVYSSAFYRFLARLRPARAFFGEHLHLKTELVSFLQYIAHTWVIFSLLNKHAFLCVV